MKWTLLRWVQLTMTGYGLIQLLERYATEKVTPLCQSTPWRKDQAITAGRIRKELERYFRQIMVRDW